MVPDTEILKRMMTMVRSVVFPEYYETDGLDWNDRPQETWIFRELRHVLAGQLRTVLPPTTAEDTTDRFMATLPEVARRLHTDVQAAMTNDPAVESEMEVVFCYPMTEVMLHYRTAHELLLLGVPLLPRMLTEMAHSATGIDIHPRATIGDYFCIDHGTGVVIGATSIIGRNVCIYQGVTLGARNFHYDEEGLPRDIPRHPIIEDNVTIYSNASVLGRITIGHDTVIGGNVWLTHDVAPHSRVLQHSATQQPSVTREV